MSAGAAAENGSGYHRRELPANRGLLLLALLSGLLAACQESASDPLLFEQAKLRLPVPGTDKAVGYFTVTNRGDRARILTEARADGVRAIEFHTMVRDGDMMRMRRLDEVALEPGETVRFESGGKHLMLFGIENLPEEVELTFTDGSGVEHAARFETFPATE